MRLVHHNRKWLLTALGVLDRQSTLVQRHKDHPVLEATILRAFCCGIATFIINPKYSPVPEVREDMERLQEQDVDSDDIGPTWIRLTQGDSMMEGPASLVLSE